MNENTHPIDKLRVINSMITRKMVSGCTCGVSVHCALLNLYMLREQKAQACVAFILQRESIDAT